MTLASRISVRTQLVSLLLLITSLMVLTSTQVEAASFDGTYDLTYSFKGPRGVETYKLAGALIISGGRTSSPRAGFFIGTVDSSGNIRMQSPTPQSPSVTAVYTGKLYSDGTGEGTYTSSGGSGSWWVKRISGPALDYVILGSASAAIAMGAIGTVASIGRLSTTGNIRGRPRETGVQGPRRIPRELPRPAPPMWMSRIVPRNFETSLPQPPGEAYTGQASGLPPPIGAIPQGGAGFQSIGADQARPIEGAGASVGGELFPRLETIVSERTATGVTLRWDDPKYEPNLRFDPDREVLLGYRVYAYEYGPTSTAPVRRVRGFVGPLARRAAVTFRQTYTFSTGGDVWGFQVEPVFLRTVGQDAGIFLGRASIIAPW